MENESQYGFTKIEWENCLKVLSVLKENPFENPDNEKFAALITKIHKNAKKSIFSVDRTQKKENDLETILNAELSKNAMNGKSFFWDDDKKRQHFTELNSPKICYCCQEYFTLAHSFYNRLCPSCADLNYEKRFQSHDLSNRNCIITGGRAKVGYATVLKLLRNKANVVLTTRFPALALEQLTQETDYLVWKDRLVVYGLDLRNLNAINEFILFYKSRFNSLDILINNAAQTIKYPDNYYLPLIKKEQKLLDESNSNQNLIANSTPISMEVKSLKYAKNEETLIQLNRFGQPVDAREKTSWNSTLDEIELHELIEVNLINQIAPYFLIKELKSHFNRTTFSEKFIVNVTSSEGMFSYNKKTIFHPHTNMTKAALNMMTLTSSKEFAKNAIFMTSVDVGWISTGAKESLREKQFENGYIPPLDSVDGASRILDPIIRGMKNNILYGVLLKNYKISEW